MKANRTSLWKNDTRAQVGIGTMIVFIATILVAATAAAVLIDTSGKLQERSSQTGNQATEQVASNLIVKGVYGYRYIVGGTMQTTITTLNVTLALAPGASSVDMAQAKIVMSDGSNRKELGWDADQGVGDTFFVDEIRDPKNSFAEETAPVLTAGGLANVQVNLTDISMTLASRTSVTFMIIPEVGSPVHADFTTPPAYGSNKAIVLR